MKDLDAPALRVADFPRALRFRMVAAYPVVSDVPDPYEATHQEIDAGFARILDNRHLRAVAVLQRPNYINRKAATNMTAVDLAAIEERVMRKHLAAVADKVPVVDFDPTSWLAGLDQTSAPAPLADVVPQFPRERWITYPNRRAVILTLCEVWLDKAFDPTDPIYLFLLTYGGRERIA